MTVIKLALVAAALGAAAHPTPKVVLVKHADFLRQSLAGATQYFVRTVSIGKEDLAAIRKSSDFTPADPDVQFYLGQGQDGKPVGATLFQQVDTPHGPLEVGLTFGPDGAISSVSSAGGGANSYKPSWIKASRIHTPRRDTPPRHDSTKENAARRRRFQPRGGGRFTFPPRC